MDVDILIPEDMQNHAHVIAALSELQDHAAAELTPRDLAENIAVNASRTKSTFNDCVHWPNLNRWRARFFAL
jgi:hypothetical protein